MTQRALGPDPGDDLDDVGVDDVAPERAGDGDAVVAVADEVHVADAVDGDRRQGLAAARGVGDPLPARADARGRRAELAVEAAVRPAVDRAQDRVELDRLQPDVALLDPPERVDDLLERQDDVDVARVAAQPAGELRHDLPAPRALEVVLGVRARKAGVPPHRIPKVLRAPAGDHLTIVTTYRPIVLYTVDNRAARGARPARAAANKARAAGPERPTAQ